MTTLKCCSLMKGWDCQRTTSRAASCRVCVSGPSMLRTCRVFFLNFVGGGSCSGTARGPHIATNVVVLCVAFQLGALGHAPCR